MNESQVFTNALKLATPAERAAYLDEACAGNPQLRADVEALLQAHAGDPGFLEQPAGSLGETADVPPASGSPSAPPPEPSGTDRPGVVLAGRYKLLEQIGEGGMGTVWIAQQTEPVKRLVAVKLIKAGMDSKQVLARFEAERQALALMDHPNIARVLDAGTTEGEPGGVSPGRPFFVMELVKGVPITTYCDEHRLTPRQRLELFVPVCHAIQHAHHKGVIHRDVKPSNVLVARYDDRPVPKVIDFGVAKAAGQQLTEPSLHTGFGAVVGTVEYMSPEQASFNQLDVDTRSDIYSLGVLLYELLAGSPPLSRKELAKAGLLEILRVIREQEPPKPSARLSTEDGLPTLAANRGTEPKRLTALVRGELDWIVMKALEKDRSRRYETANGLAMDLQHYLNDENVLACPPSVGYRLRKFVRRHRGPVLAACLVVLALILGVIGTTWGMVRAEQQRQIAEVNAQKALAAAAAEKEAKETAVAREAETQAVLDFVESKILAAAQPEGQEGGLGRDVMLRRALEEALPFVETSFTDHPLIEARLRLTLGTSFWRLGEGQIAAEQCERARTLYTKHLGPDHPDTIGSMSGVANSYSALGRHADALALREEVLALYTKRLGPDHPCTLRCMLNLAVSYSALGRDADAMKLNEETLALMKVRLGPDDPETLKSMDNLAGSYTVLGRPLEALKLHEEALALLKARRGPDHPDTLLSKNNLCVCYAALGRHDDAVKLGEETVALLKTKLGPGHRHTLASMSELANNYDAIGRNADALNLREEMLPLQKARLGPDHPDTLASMMWLAVSYDRLGRYDEAVKLGEETLALRRVKLGPDHPDTIASMLSLAYSYAALDRHADALKLYEETFAIRKAKLGPHHRATLVSMNNIAGCYKALGRHAEALKLQEETLALRNAKLGPDDPDTLFSMNQLVISYANLGRHADASKLLEEMLPLRKAKLGADHPDTLKNMHDLAYCYGVLGRHADSLKLIEERLAIMKATLGPDHPDTLLAMNDRANHYADFGRHAEALKLREELLPLMKARLGRDDPTTLGSMNNLALSYANLGRHADALKLNEETLALKKATLGPDHPDTLSSMDNLAVNCAALGRHTNALKLREATLTMRKDTLGADHPATLWSMWGVAESLVGLDRGAEAVPIIDECLKRAAGKEVDPSVIAGVMVLRLRHFEKVKDVVGCRTTAEMWEKLKRTDAASLYDAARMRSVTAAVIRATDKSEDAAKDATAEAVRAMAWLKQAVAAGYKDAAHMKKDRGLDALRDRDDFLQLLAELEARKN